MNTMEMLATHPDRSTLAQGQAELVAQLLECAETCTSCADACLAEPKIDMLRRCIRTDLDCADICQATGRVLTRQTQPSAELVRALVEACATACSVCAEECEQHAGQHEHCRICGQICRDCEEACQRFAGGV